MNIKNKQVQILDDEFVEIQNKFVNLKKAEQEFVETLNHIENEERFIEIMTKLKELDNNIQIPKKKIKEDLSYIG